MDVSKWFTSYTALYFVSAVVRAVFDVSAEVNQHLKATYTTGYL